MAIGRPSHRVTRMAMFVLAPIALLALGAAGYLVGRGGDEQATPAATLTQQATRAGIQLRYPAGWTQQSTPPAIPGLSFKAPLILSGSGADDWIVAGVVKTAVGSDLLPAELRGRLATEPVPEPVLLGDIQALRYAGLKVDLASALTLYAVPTADGSVVVSCHAPAGSAAFFDACERSAATLRLDGPRAFAVGPNRDYGQRLATAIGALDDAITGEGAKLRRARSASAQATSAGEIAQVFERVAAAMGTENVSARDREGHLGLVGAIAAGGQAYSRLSAASRTGDRARYRQAADAVRTADARLRRAIVALRTLGYAS